MFGNQKIKKIRKKESTWKIPTTRRDGRVITGRAVGAGLGWACSSRVLGRHKWWREK